MESSNVKIEIGITDDWPGLAFYSNFEGIAGI
jgi:hypothetical protein